MKSFGINIQMRMNHDIMKNLQKFTRDLATSLRCTSVLEVGCGTGIDLRLFPDTFEIHGIDLNDHALDIAKEKFYYCKF